MKKRYIILAAASILMLMGCNDTSREIQPLVTRIQQPILYGENDTGNPAIVALIRTEVYNGENYYYTYCTGTLIHPQWILTAAHCVAESEDYFTLATANELNKTAKIYFNYGHEAFLADTAGEDAFYWPSTYVDCTNSNAYDIALIKLKNPIAADIAKPILPLPKWLGITREILPVPMEIVGFGYDDKGGSDVKNKTTRQITHYCGGANHDSNDGCQFNVELHVKACHPSPDYCDYYGELVLDGEYDVTLQHGTIADFNTKNRQCQGDSGGPSIYTLGGVQYVAGITSYGDTSCAAYNVSTAVQDYYDWMIKVAPEIADQYQEICGNGIDDDNNGLTDDEDFECAVCGNGILNKDEACDKDRFADDISSCTAYDSIYDSGNLACHDDCTIDVSACHVKEFCGDGIISQNEVCDRSDQNGEVFSEDKNSCELIVGKGSEGSIRCSSDCASIDVSGCSEPGYCGDGIVNKTEMCDGESFLKDRKLCAQWDEKYISGEVKCSDKCGLDFSGCELTSICGDEIISGMEECDTLEFKNNVILCSEYDPKFTSGRVTCSPSCKINYANCRIDEIVTDEICDNNKDDDKNGLEDCSDPACLADVACKEQPICGDGKRDPGELCDGDVFELNKTLCSEWISVFKTGKVTCNNNCTINYDQCSTYLQEICDNGIDDNGNELTDCKDPECAYFNGCNTAGNKDNTGDNPSKDNGSSNDNTGENPSEDNGSSNDEESGSSSSCSAQTSTPAPAGFMTFCLMGILAFLRRRQNNH